MPSTNRKPTMTRDQIRKQVIKTFTTMQHPTQAALAFAKAFGIRPRSPRKRKATRAVKHYKHGMYSGARKLMHQRHGVNQ